MLFSRLSAKYIDDNVLNYFLYPVLPKIHWGEHFSGQHFICLSPHSSVARINAPHLVLSVNSPWECSKWPWYSGASGAKLCTSTRRRLNIILANNKNRMFVAFLIHLDRLHNLSFSFFFLHFYLRRIISAGNWMLIILSLNLLRRRQKKLLISTRNE